MAFGERDWGELPTPTKCSALYPSPLKGQFHEIIIYLSVTDLMSKFAKCVSPYSPELREHRISELRIQDTVSANCAYMTMGTRVVWELSNRLFL